MLARPNTTGLQSILVVLFFFSSNLNNSHAGILSLRPTSTSQICASAKTFSGSTLLPLIYKIVLHNCRQATQMAFQLSTMPAATCAVGTHQF